MKKIMLGVVKRMLQQKSNQKMLQKQLKEMLTQETLQPLLLKRQSMILEQSKMGRLYQLFLNTKIREALH